MIVLFFGRFVGGGGGGVSRRSAAAGIIVEFFTGAGVYGGGCSCGRRSATAFILGRFVGCGVSPSAGIIAVFVTGAAAGIVVPFVHCCRSGGSGSPWWGRSVETQRYC